MPLSLPRAPLLHHLSLKNPHNSQVWTELNRQHRFESPESLIISLIDPGGESDFFRVAQAAKKQMPSSLREVEIDE